MNIKNIFPNIILFFANIFNLSYGISILYYFADTFTNSNLGTLSFNLLFPALILLILPFIFFIINFKVKDVDEIVKFFLSVEIPIFCLCLFRIICLKELTPIYLLILLTCFISIIVYTIDLYSKKEKSLKLNTVLTMLYEAPVIVLGYISFLALFYVIPSIILLFRKLWHIICYIISDFGGFVYGIITLIKDFIYNPLEFFILTFIIIFLSCSLILFLFGPITTIVVYIKAFIEKFKITKCTKPVLIFAFAYTVTMFLVSYHFSDIGVEKYYDEVRQARSYKELQTCAKQILPKQWYIKLSVKDSYLSVLRYLFDNKSNSVYWAGRFADMPKSYCKISQKIFDKVSYPFRFNSEFYTLNSSNHYRELFDEDIQSAMNKEISASVNSTYFFKQEAASLLDINSKDVKALYRHIDIKETKDKGIYKVDLEERYLNRTARNKEVYYEFSLPKEAVITEMYLGDELQYKGNIAPKGAARKTYENQIRTSFSSDPALLEKSGPVQYTLRVYPVPAKLRLTDQKQYQKIKFSYLIKEKNGTVALPNICQTRNVYSNFTTQYKVTLNGQNLKIAPGSTLIKVTDKNTAPKNINLKNKKIAFLFDTSYSNQTDWKDFARKNISKYTKENTFDYYFFNKFLSDKIPDLQKSEQLNFAQTSRYDAYASLTEDYDAVIMLTDGSVYDNSKYITPEINAPLYVVHIDKKGIIPPYKNDFTQLIYSTKGNVVQNIEQAFEEIARNEQKETEENPQFKNAKIIEDILQSGRPFDEELKSKVYELSKEAGIVSDYASYIALENETQEKELQENIKQKDKFDANLKTGEDEGLKNMNVFSVPEPEDYIFMFLIVLTLILYFFRKKIRCLYSK